MTFKFFTIYTLRFLNIIIILKTLNEREKGRGKRRGEERRADKNFIKS